MNEISARLVRDFEAMEAKLNGSRGTVLHELRKKAIDTFVAQGFPTIRNEEWKYTNVMQIVNKEYVSPTVDESTLADTVTKNDIFGGSANLVVFVNGHYSSVLSSIKDSTDVVIESLHSAIAKQTENLEERVGSLIDHTTNGFTALNSAFVEDGLYLDIKPNAVVERPIYVLSLLTAESANVLAQPRNIINVGKSSQSTVIFRSVTIGNNLSLVNSGTEIFVAENAQCTVIQIQDDTETASTINTVNADQRRDSVLTVITVSLSGAIVRNTIGTRLSESNSTANMYGVYCLDGNTLVDNHTVMDHAVPNCLSNELYKGILDGKSQGVFNGKIFVRQDAQKTLAYQSNRNILLSDTATINTKPQLEIWADDVKCSHGCAVGQLDENALFYLQARGIPETPAKALLLTAFAEDVTSRIENDVVREFVNSNIESRLIPDSK
jgi:Fe-S cluster assembly protein SufD